MSTPKSDESLDSPYRPFTSAERIRQLIELDKSITQLVHSAGLALKTLTNAQSDSSVIQTPPSANTRKELFAFSANSYLSTLQSIDVRLQRNIIGLEEAGIIVPGRQRKQVEQELGLGLRGQQPKTGGEQRKTTELGLSNLDVGWLNSRSGRVGREMEAELWEKARLLLEELGDEGDKEEVNDAEDKAPDDLEVMEL